MDSRAPRGLGVGKVDPETFENIGEKDYALALFLEDNTPRVIDEIDAYECYAKIVAFYHDQEIRPRETFEQSFEGIFAVANNPTHETIEDYLVDYLHKIVTGHPLNNGNKRFAFLVGQRFLNKNGYDFRSDEISQIYNLLLHMARGEKINFYRRVKGTVKRTDSVFWPMLDALAKT